MRKELITIGLTVYVLLLAIRLILLVYNFTWEGLGEFLIGYVLYAGLICWTEKEKGLKTLIISGSIFSMSLMVCCLLSLIVFPDLKRTIIFIISAGFTLGLFKLSEKLC